MYIKLVNDYFKYIKGGERERKIKRGLHPLFIRGETFFQNQTVLIGFRNVLFFVLFFLLMRVFYQMFYSLAICYLIYDCYWIC